MKMFTWIGSNPAKGLPSFGNLFFLRNFLVKRDLTVFLDTYSLKSLKLVK